VSVQILERAALIELVVNGERRTGVAEPRTLLSDFLRHELGLTGTHVGCEHGVCGACTVEIDGRLARSCITLAVQVQGSSVRTIEGVATSDDFHPIQEAFRDNYGLQCGFCTPGFVMATVSLLKENPSPTESEIRHALEGNLCRCTGYHNIVRAVEAAARAGA
jgi:aerobic-type carbon monoxide dehydrogenase small subunit (CoxS/CutS family)